MARILIAVQEDAVASFLKSFQEHSKKRNREDEYVTASNPVEIKDILSREKFDGMVTQYQMGAVPFSAKDIAGFKDSNESMRVVIIVPSSAKGGRYLSELLILGVYNAVYDDEARVPRVMRLIDERRKRSDAQAYYGIVDLGFTAESVTGDMSQYTKHSAEDMDKFMHYLVNGDDAPFDQRFIHVAKMCSMDEIDDLVQKKFDQSMIEEMKKYPGLRNYLPKEPVKEEKKRGGGFFGFFKKNSAPVSNTQDDVDEDYTEPVKPVPKKDEPKKPEIVKTEQKSETMPEPKQGKKPEPKNERTSIDVTDAIGGNAAAIDDFFDDGDVFEESEPKAEKQEQKKSEPKKENKPVPKPETKVPDSKKDNNQNNKPNSQNNNQNSNNNTKENGPNNNGNRDNRPDNHNADRRADNRGNNPPEKQRTAQQELSERAKADAEEKKRLEEERIRREEKLREDARKDAEQKAAKQKEEADKREAELKAENEKIAREANEKLAQEKKALEEKANADKKVLEEQKAAELRAKDDEIKRAKAEADRKAKEDAEKLANAEAEKARLEKEKEQQIKAQQKREQEHQAQIEKLTSELNMSAKEEIAKMKAEFQKQLEEIQKSSNAQIEEMQRASDARMKQAEAREKAAEKRVKKAESNIKTVIQKELVSRRVVGVFGLSKGYDAVPIAIQLAKTLSQYEPVTYVEVPRATAGVFTRYNLEKLIPGFKSVPHMVQKGETNYSSVRNQYAEVNFFVTNDNYGEPDSSFQSIATMINGTSDNIVLEAGMSLEDARKAGLLNLCTKAVILVDHEEEEMYIPRIKAEAESLGESNIETYVLSVSDKGNEPSTLSADIYHSAVKRVTKESISFLGMKVQEEQKLLGYFGLAGAKKLERTKQNVKIEFMGTRDIAIFGAERGNGVTHTCLMLADSVCKEFRTAIIELNRSGHMEALAKEEGIEDESGKMMNYGGIDIYYNMTWQEFSTNYRSDYQIVIIDFGTYTNAFQKQKNGQDYRPICIQCAKKYLVFDPSPWRLSVLEKLVPLLDSDSDPNCQIEMLAPLTMKKDLKKYGLYARVGNREIHCLPNTEEPVRGGRDAMANEVRPLVLSK